MWGQEVGQRTEVVEAELQREATEGKARRLLIMTAFHAKLDTLSGKLNRTEPGDEDGGSSENPIQMP